MNFLLLVLENVLRIPHLTQRLLHLHTQEVQMSDNTLEMVSL